MRPPIENRRSPVPFQRRTGAMAAGFGGQSKKSVSWSIEIPKLLRSLDRALSPERREIGAPDMPLDRREESTPERSTRGSKAT